MRVLLHLVLVGAKATPIRLSPRLIRCRPHPIACDGGGEGDANILEPQLLFSMHTLCCEGEDDADTFLAPTAGDVPRIRVCYWWGRRRRQYVWADTAAALCRACFSTFGIGEGEGDTNMSEPSRGFIFSCSLVSCRTLA